MVEQVALEGERAHAVADEHERDAGVLAAGKVAEDAQVVDEPRPAARAEVAVAVGGAGRAAVSPMVVGVHDVPGVGEGFGQPPVPGGVLAHAVRDLHDGLRRAIPGPAVGRDLGAVGAREREGRLVHAAMIPDHARRPRHPSRGWRCRRASKPGCAGRISRNRLGAVKLEPQPVADLADDVRRLGVRSGDVVMVHASLRAVGPVAGGADGVLDALEAVVGPEGTLLMTVGARDDWGWVNDRPEAERPLLLRDAEPFDCLLTPADPDVGVLAEVFRTRPGTLVSDHPEGRFAASGRLASVLVERRAVGRLLRPGLAAGAVRASRGPGAAPRGRHRHRHAAPLRRVPGTGPLEAPRHPSPDGGRA